MVTFVAVENPAGLLGFKQRGVLTDANKLSDFPLPYQGTDVVAKGAKPSKVDVYAKRHAYFVSRKPEWADTKQGIAGDLLADSLGNREVVVEIVKRIKNDPTARVLMCSSVNSLTKYIANYCVTNVGTKIDTLIIFGHGGSDSMNVGLGRIGGIGNAALDDADDEEETTSLMKIRSMSGLEPREGSPKKARTREIALDNQDRWLSSFAQLQPHVQARGDTSFFHLFLMACSIGKGPPKAYQDSLVTMSAGLLTKVLGEEVAVAAPKKGITPDELFLLLKDLPAICREVVTGNQVSLGEVTLVTSLE